METKVMYYVILTLQSFNEPRNRTNYLKPAMVKRPLFYPTDVEKENYDEIKSISRKYWGLINFNQLMELIDDCNFTNTCDTMGSLTMEYGWISAVSFEADGQDYHDGSESRVNAYISPVYDDNFLNSFDKIDEPHKQEVWHHMDKVMKWLKDEALDAYYEIRHKDAEAPMFLQEVYFDLQQLFIPEFV